MMNYKLKEDEVVLYKGDGEIIGKKGTTQILLTNYNIVFINSNKKLFSKEEITVSEFPIVDIKVYEDEPQIKSKGSKVEIYLRKEELEILFSSAIEASKFIAATKKLILGTTTAERGAKKVKETINLVDDTLGVDSVHVVGDVLKEGVVGSLTKSLGKVGKAFFDKLKK